MSHFAIVSRYEASLNSMPLFADKLMPISVDIGVASPKAQGQAMTMTEMEIMRDFSNPAFPR